MYPALPGFCTVAHSKPVRTGGPWARNLSKVDPHGRPQAALTRTASPPSGIELPSADGSRGRSRWPSPLPTQSRMARIASVPSGLAPSGVSRRGRLGPFRPSPSHRSRKNGRASEAAISPPAVSFVERAARGSCSSRCRAPVGSADCSAALITPEFWPPDIPRTSRSGPGRPSPRHWRSPRLATFRP